MQLDRHKKPFYGPNPFVKLGIVHDHATQERRGTVERTYKEWFKILMGTIQRKYLQDCLNLTKKSLKIIIRIPMAKLDLGDLEIFDDIVYRFFGRSQILLLAYSARSPLSAGVQIN